MTDSKSFPFDLPYLRRVASGEPIDDNCKDDIFNKTGFVFKSHDEVFWYAIALNQVIARQKSDANDKHWNNLRSDEHLSALAKVYEVYPTVDTTTIMFLCRAMIFLLQQRKKDQKKIAFDVYATLVRAATQFKNILRSHDNGSVLSGANEVMEYAAALGTLSCVEGTPERAVLSVIAYDLVESVSAPDTVDLFCELVALAPPSSDYAQERIVRGLLSMATRVNTAHAASRWCHAANEAMSCQLSSEHQRALRESVTVVGMKIKCGGGVNELLKLLGKIHMANFSLPEKSAWERMMQRMMLYAVNADPKIFINFVTSSSREVELSLELKLAAVAVLAEMARDIEQIDHKMWIEAMHIFAQTLPGWFMLRVQQAIQRVGLELGKKSSGDVAYTAWKNFVDDKSLKDNTEFAAWMSSPSIKRIMAQVEAQNSPLTTAT